MEEKLSGRSFGYYMWKPYIILAQLKKIRDGDWVVYSDVGKKHPYAIFHRLHEFMNWANANNGGIFPGVYIPEWDRTADGPSAIVS